MPLPEYYRCYQYPATKDGIYDIQRKDCLDEVIAESSRPSEPNPFLQSINSGASYSKHTVFYGNAAERSALAEGFDFTDAFQVRFARAMKSIYGVSGDGVVPISSACRLGSSTGTASSCAGSPFANLIDTEFTHTEIKNAPNMPAYTAELLRVADTLLDIDDGTLDGNRRTYIGTEDSSAGCTDSEEDGVCDAAVDAEKPLEFIDVDFGEIDVQPSGDVRYLRIGEDIDGNERFGDNSLDMSDFRRWRDWYIGSSDEAELDGSFNHMKKDMNGDEGILILPRWADFNGDGNVTFDDRATVAGITPTSDMSKNQDGKPFLTDLEVLSYTAEQRGIWSDVFYTTKMLPSLLNSGDIEIWVRDLYDLPNVFKVESVIDGDLARWNRLHTDDSEGQRHVYTLPVGNHVAHIYARDDKGNLVLELQKAFEVKLGSDTLWAPYVDFKPEIVKTYDSRVDDCTRLEGIFTLELRGLFDNEMPDIPLEDENAVMNINQELVAILEKEKLNNEPLQVLAKTVRHCNIERGPDQELGFLISYFDEVTKTGFYAHIYDTFDNVDNRWPTYIWNYTNPDDIWIVRDQCPPLTLNAVLGYRGGKVDETQTISGLTPGAYGTVYMGFKTQYWYDGFDSAGERVGLGGMFSPVDYYIDEKTSYRGVEQWRHLRLAWDTYGLQEPGEADVANCWYQNPADEGDYDEPSRDSSQDWQYPPPAEFPYVYGYRGLR